VTAISSIDSLEQRVLLMTDCYGAPYLDAFYSDETTGTEPSFNTLILMSPGNKVIHVPIVGPCEEMDISTEVWAAIDHIRVAPEAIFSYGIKIWEELKVIMTVGREIYDTLGVQCTLFLQKDHIMVYILGGTKGVRISYDPIEFPKSGFFRLFLRNDISLEKVAEVVFSRDGTKKIYASGGVDLRKILEVLYRLGAEGEYDLKGPHLAVSDTYTVQRWSVPVADCQRVMFPQNV
jgi:hypothetical protein